MAFPWALNPPPPNRAQSRSPVTFVVVTFVAPSLSVTFLIFPSRNATALV